MGSIVLSLLGLLAYALIIIVVTAVIGSSDPALGLGMVLAQLVQLPFALLASLLSVLLVAVPALYYERGEVVTISAAALHPSRPCGGFGHAGVRQSHLRHRDEHR